MKQSVAVVSQMNKPMGDIAHIDSVYDNILIHRRQASVIFILGGGPRIHKFFPKSRVVDFHDLSMSRGHRAFFAPNLGW